MSYQDDAILYRDGDFRNRAEMCVREQAYVFSADGRVDIASLGQSIVGGNYAHLDAVIAAAVTAPGSGDLSDDGALLSAVQAVWPSVAAALYPVSVPADEPA